MKLKSIIVLGLLTQAGQAFAVDIPNIVGTWEATSGYWSQTGTDSNPAPTELSQNSIHQNLIIVNQQGNAFHGKTIRSSGESRNLAGVIGLNGKSLFVSIDYGTGTGSLSEDGSEIWYCGTTIQLTRNFAFCTTFKKMR
jgi:hypothetical protein